jgi:membrane peptidoglycan carboxypeptidase
MASSASTESMKHRLVQSIVKRRYSEEDLLRLALSQLYFGRDGARDIVGVSDAAKTYFGKTPADMTLPEAALLAAIIGNPNTLSPVRSPDRAAQRRDALLEDMLGCGYITRDEYLRAIAGAIPAESLLLRRTLNRAP